MNNSNMKLTVSSSPHIRCKETTQSIMQNVVIALLPALAVAGYVFGVKALLIVAICVASCVISEMLVEKFMKKPVTIGDWSAVVTGVLLAFNLPVNAPWWMCIIGSVFAIVIVKQLFGGLGQNFINPALTARAMLLASWPTHMTGTAYIPTTDTYTTATPLGILKEGSNLAAMPSNLDMFLGLNGVYGAIGEISALALLIGGIYLIVRGVISWRIPTVYLATVAVLSICFGQDPIFMLCSGGLMLGAFFMATDYVTSPCTVKGQFIYAFGCGLMTMIIRMVGGYPEGVSYSILLMNLAAPLIERYTRPAIYGAPPKEKKKKSTEKEGEVSVNG
jgi:electron transport complex protein RnfD